MSIDYALEKLSTNGKGKSKKEKIENRTERTRPKGKKIVEKRQRGVRTVTLKASARAACSLDGNMLEHKICLAGVICSGRRIATT